MQEEGTLWGPAGRARRGDQLHIGLGLSEGEGRAVDWGPSDGWHGHAAGRCRGPSLAIPAPPGSGFRPAPRPAPRPQEEAGGGCPRRRRESGLGCSRAARAGAAEGAQAAGEAAPPARALPARRPAPSPRAGVGPPGAERLDRPGPAGRRKDARTERRGRA